VGLGRITEPARLLPLALLVVNPIHTLPGVVLRVGMMAHHQPRALLVRLAIVPEAVVVEVVVVQPSPLVLQECREVLVDLGAVEVVVAE
jgi:hypothetical protein